MSLSVLPNDISLEIPKHFGKPADLISFLSISKKVIEYHKTHRNLSRLVIIIEYINKHCKYSNLSGNILEKAARYGYIDVVQYLSLSTTYINSYQLLDSAVAALNNGHIDVIKELISIMHNYDVSVSSKILSYVSKMGNDELVKILLNDSRINPYDINICLISTYGNNTAKLLIEDPRSDPNFCGGKILSYASKNGSVEVVRSLLQHPNFNPVIISCNALFGALENNHIEVGKLLIQDTRIFSAQREDLRTYFMSKFGLC